MPEKPVNEAPRSEPPSQSAPTPDSKQYRIKCTHAVDGSWAEWLDYSGPGNWMYLSGQPNTPGGMVFEDDHGGGYVYWGTTPDTALNCERVPLAPTWVNWSGNIVDEPPTNGANYYFRQFARVSLGALGIVTRITLDVLPRPCANTLQGGRERYRLKTKSEFVAKFKELLTGPKKHTRLESFFTPYAAQFPPIGNFLVLWWDVVANPNPPIPNSAVEPKSACELSREDQFGAPLIGIGKFGEEVVRAAQTTDPYWLPPAGPAVITAIALDEIESQVRTANQAFSDLWLAKSSRVIFMSYFIELPGLDDAGLEKAWEGLEVVNTYVTQSNNFHIAAPMEFRFVKGGDSAMSGTFSKNRDAYFVNLDLIAWVEPTKSSEYPAELLKFFAHVERKWVSLGGLPHNGKMFGFYDPTDHALDSYTPPLNKKFLSFITKQRIDTRQAPVDALKKYRKTCDPNGLFYTQYLRDLLEG